MFKMGIPVKYYKDIEVISIDAIVITTKFIPEVLDIIQTELPHLNKPVFEDIDHFLAFEYVNITHKDIVKNPFYIYTEKNCFLNDTDKRLQYLEVYNKYFERFRNTDVTIMEIGVYQGASLQLWKEYFGSKCKIIGIDINEECIKYNDGQIEVEIGSQESIYFWNYIKNKYPKIDIILDDGGHTMKQQIVTFEQMFSHLSENGVYMCEDVFTSYWTPWGGGWGKRPHLLNI